MFIGNAMNQPASTMPNPYSGDVVDGAKYDLPGECVMGKGASEQKANLAAMLRSDGARTLEASDSVAANELLTDETGIDLVLIDFDAELGESLAGVPHCVPIGLAAHQNADEWTRRHITDLGRA